MTKAQKTVSIVLALLVCVMLAVSIADTVETRKTTNFDQDKIITHIEKLTEYGPRSIAHPEANQKALDYIISELESYGAVNNDTTETTAYMVQDFVGTDTRYQSWYLKNIIVHIPANSENPTGDAVMFMGHTDSVPMGNGASDDGVACSVMLEAIRYYTDQIKNGYVLSNDLVFCFVNGEEYGLYGSKAFMGEFDGFDNIVDRIKFGVNLESRGTSGTLIMFETAKNNYNTVKLFSEVNKSLFTCSIATMVYDMMPNSTDFTSFKEVYQGINVANVNGGENYHTQNDNAQNVGYSYMSQQAQLVDGMIDRLSQYDLEKLYDADESAIFFSYLNLTTVVYNHTSVVILAVIGIILVAANIILSRFYRKQHNFKNTALSIVAVFIGLLLTAAVTYGCYYLFQYIAVLFGNIDIHAVGTITYSNTAIVIGIGIVALAMTALTAHFTTKWFKVTSRDLIRAFAYIHAFMGIVLSFALPDASYLFMFSGLILMANELAVTASKDTDISAYHFELLGTALYFPIVIPVIVLATSALGLTMAYVYGLVFALAIFDIGVCIVPLCKYISLRRIKKKDVSPAEGALHILACALVLFLAVSLARPNASVNLQGKQNIVKLPYDDALVYVLNAEGESEYRIYDLNAYRALKKYSPEMTFGGEYYAGEGEKQDISHSILSTADKNVLTVKKTDADSLVYLDFVSEGATSFTVDDGTTSNTFEFDESGVYTIKLHSDCTVTVNGGKATVEYKEVLRDYASLIPAEYASDSEQLHFNLWLTEAFSFGE